MQNVKKINCFLGGTCNNSQWRERLIPKLTDRIEAYNPVVPNWTPECQEIEKEKRKTSDVIVYVITPLMTGVFAIAEAVQDSNIRPLKTIFCYLETDEMSEFTTHQLKSLKATAELIRENGAFVAKDLDEVADIINKVF